MLYVTGGLAWARVRNSVAVDCDLSDGVPGFEASNNTTRWGWTAGFGSEWAFGNGWSIKSEASPLRRMNQRAACFLHLILAAAFHPSCSTRVNAPLRLRESAIFRRVGQQLVDDHGDSHRGAGIHPEIRTRHLDLLAVLCAVRLDQAERQLAQIGAFRVFLHKDVMGAPETNDAFIDRLS